MSIREMKHEARLIEWEERIAACRSSGAGVSRWCREQGISAKTYYRWEREVLAKAGEQYAARRQRENPLFVEVSPAREALPAVEPGQGIAVARLYTTAGELEVYRGADRETLLVIMGVLKDAE